MSRTLPQLKAASLVRPPLGRGPQAIMDLRAGGRVEKPMGTDASAVEKLHAPDAKAE